jgi:SAM-dependent methyltransferase
VTERFDADWLALREPFDHAARSVMLARRLAECLPARRPLLLDLGAGTGSLFRFLAPIIGRGQDWMLVDADAALLDDAFGRTAAWARQRGYAATAPGDALLVHTPRGLWRMQAVHRDLARIGSASAAHVPGTPLPLAGEVAERSDAGESLPSIRRPSPGATRRPLPLAGEAYVAATLALPESDAVLCSALLDLVSRHWLERLVALLRTPFLACLAADGRDSWQPRDPTDTVVRTAFRRDQRRDKGFGPALGITASSVTLRALSARGFTTISAPSDWRIPRSALRMQRALIEGTAGVAGTPAASWQSTRLHQAMRGRLAIRIGHRDILALPQGG